MLGSWEKFWSDKGNSAVGIAGKVIEHVFCLAVVRYLLELTKVSYMQLEVYWNYTLLLLVSLQLPFRESLFIAVHLAARTL